MRDTFIRSTDYLHPQRHRSGTIGSIPFANAEFTITNVGDTAHRASGFGLFYIDAISASNCVAAEVGCHFPPPPLLAPIRNVSRSHRCFILLALAFRQRTVGHMNIFSACGIRMSGSRRAISSKYNVACNATLANRADARKSPLSASVCRVCTSAEQTSFDAYPKSLRSDFPVAAFLVCSGTELVSDCTNLLKKL